MRILRYVPANNQDGRGKSTNFKVEVLRFVRLMVPIAALRVSGGTRGL